MADEEHSEDPEWIPREREESLCPCKSKLPYKECCMLYHYGRARPETAEQLMRSRYSAFFFRRVEYLYETTHPTTRDPDLRKDLCANIDRYKWSFLEIVNTSKGGKDDKVGKVEFIANYYLGMEECELHEHSRFKRYKGMWKYLDDKG